MGSFILLGQVLGLAFACGLNLYATVAALGILSRLGLAELPSGLRGLEGGLVIATAAALYLVEAVIDKVRHADSLWDAVHTFIRPPAAAFLAVAALWPHGIDTKIAGAGLAGLVALSAHGAKAGLRLALNTEPRPALSMTVSFLEDALAVTLAVFALRQPTWAVIGAGGALGLVALAGHRLWRAFTLGLRALLARLRGFFLPARWRELDDLPRDLRELVEPTPLGAAPPRVARAGITGLKGVGAYRSGWLVVANGRPSFVYRSLLGGKQCPLPTSSAVHVRSGIWADFVQVAAEEGRYTLLLLKDGPDTELARSDLQPDTA